MPDCGEHALDRVQGSQMLPLLGGEVVANEQRLGVLGQTGDAARVFGSYFSLKVSIAASAAARVSAWEISRRSAATNVPHQFREAVEHVRGLPRSTP